MQKQGEFWYPDSEEHLHCGHARVRDIEQFILPRCDSRGICVQAGGAAGVWPIKLAEHFRFVNTFEPNPILWECLNKNIADRDVDNVFPNHCGLWHSKGNCKMVNIQDNNMGAWHIEMTQNTLDTEVTTIDEEKFAGCDLLVLDIEGAEIEALQGARRTINRFKPIIVVEMKPATLRAFGHTVDQLRAKITQFGYKLGDRFGRDELWEPIH